MNPQPETASKWVEEAMGLANALADAGVAGWSTPDHVAAAKTASAEGQLLAHLTKQDALMAQLAGAAKNYAERYCKDEADAEGPEYTGCTQQQHEDAVALFAAVAAYEESK